MASDEERDEKVEKSRPSAEELFLAGRGEEDEEFDRELLELTRDRSRGSVLRPILMVLVIVFIASVIMDWRDELAYFFSPSEPLPMGDIADFPVLSAEDPDWSPPVAHNRYVSLEGMPTRISRGGSHEFFRLIGGEFYVQRDLPEAVDRDVDRKLPSRQELLGMSGATDRVRYQGQGRLMSFAEAPQRFQGLKRHYGDRYGTRFCEDYSPRQIQEMERQQAEDILANWSQRYEGASQEDRERRQLTPEPTRAQIDRLVATNPVCVHAYLIHDGQRPVDLWWYVLFSALLGALMVFNIFKLVRWFRDWLRP